MAKNLGNTITIRLDELNPTQCDVLYTLLGEMKDISADLYADNPTDDNGDRLAQLMDAMLGVLDEKLTNNGTPPARPSWYLGTI